jgi:UPF0755 protein
MSRRIRWFLALSATVIALAAVVAGVIAYTLYARVGEPFKGYDESEQFVDIPSGAGAGEIGRRLIAAGVVRDDLTFRLALRRSGAATRLKAGEYRFDHPVAASEVIDKIARGEVYLRFLTFPEGLTIAEMARLYEAAGFGYATDFVEAASDPTPIRSLDPAAEDLEGYLFPETYALSRQTTASELVQSMVRRFWQVFTPELEKLASERGMDVRQAVTLASIIEKETGKEEERALVAGVFANRLRIGMLVQSDPTVIYALRREGLYTGNLTRQGLAFDSPYNTYRYPGLPPGPIASPGRKSLEAALSPAETEYLYFVSRNDGSHVFARTLKEHNRNVYEHQILYFREKRREAARAAQEPGGTK